MNNKNKAQKERIKTRYDEKIEEVFLHMSNIEKYRKYLFEELHKLAVANRAAKILDEEMRLLSASEVENKTNQKL